MVQLILWEYSERKLLQQIKGIVSQKVMGCPHFPIQPFVHTTRDSYGVTVCFIVSTD